MPTLDHTIVEASDPGRSAALLADVLGLTRRGRWIRSRSWSSKRGTSLHYLAVEGPVHPQHYAFRVTEAEFDTAFDNIRNLRLRYWADPQRTESGVINDWDGGRGVYFEDSDGHLLEIVTRSDGTGGSTATRPHPLVAGE